MKIKTEYAKLKNKISETNGNINKDVLFNALEHLEEVFKFKKTIDPIKYYYLDHNRYNDLDEHVLQGIFNKYFCKKLSERNAREMIQLLSRIYKQNRKLILFKNDIIFDSKTGKVVKNYNDDLIVRNINFSFNNNVEYDIRDLDDPNITLVQKTLEEILIPKDDPTNDLYYLGFLERVGSCINYSNKHKRISLYLGKSNRGKNILSTLLQKVYEDTVYTTQAESLNGRFSEANLIGKYPIIFEELGGKSFLYIQSKLKAISGGDRISCEIKNVQKPVESDKFGKIFGFCNILPNVNMEDSGILKRIDIINLPNTFLTREEYEHLTIDEKKRSYVKNEDLKDNIQEDYDGLEWLINASIKAYGDMRENGRDYVDSLSDSETLIKLGQDNPVQSFINNYVTRTEKSEDELFNSDIAEELEIYLESNGICNIPSNSLPMRIRDALDNKYGRETMSNWTGKSGTKKYIGFKLGSENGGE